VGSCGEAALRIRYDAILRYEAADSLLAKEPRFFLHDDLASDLGVAAKQLRVECLVNLAACAVKTEHWQRVKTACSQVRRPCWGVAIGTFLILHTNVFVCFGGRLQDGGDPVSCGGVLNQPREKISFLFRLMPTTCLYIKHLLATQLAFL
jgi:hypothetical protein